MVLSEGWKVREITGGKAWNILHFEVEAHVQNVLYVHGFLVAPFLLTLRWLVFVGGRCPSKHSFVTTTSLSS